MATASGGLAEDVRGMAHEIGAPPMSQAARNPTERFSDRVDDYIKYRPHYSPEVVQALRQACGLAPEHVIADVGCGTGLLAEILLEHGNQVIGIEPNREMRQAGEQYLARFPTFRMVTGSAEETALPDASVDFVVAGQAFHWFRPEPTRREFSRILKPGDGRCSSGMTATPTRHRFFGPMKTSFSGIPSIITR